jgi:hypothetical protein
MTPYRFSTRKPSGWDEFCARESLFFGSAEWLDILESSFGCRSVYAWNGHDGIAISAFAAGPFSVAYIGFPAGCVDAGATSIEDMLAQLSRNRTKARLTCARVIVSGFSDGPRLERPFVSNPETAIADLQAWDLMGVSKNLRRDIRKAARSGLRVREIDDPAHGQFCFELYASTVKRHGGSLRYNREYFTSLLRLARNGGAVRLYLAEMDSSPVGFAVIARHADTAFYLHGGASAGARHLSPSDLILSEAITAEKEAGCRAFNFMASPADQTTLVRYKEKWGGETRTQHTYTIGTSAAYPLFRLAEKLYRILT